MSWNQILCSWLLRFWLVFILRFRSFRNIHKKRQEISVGLEQFDALSHVRDKWF